MLHSKQELIIIGFNLKNSFSSPFFITLSLLYRCINRNLSQNNFGIFFKLTVLNPNAAKSRNVTMFLRKNLSIRFAFKMLTQRFLNGTACSSKLSYIRSSLVFLNEKRIFSFTLRNCIDHCSTALTKKLNASKEIIESKRMNLEKN